MSNIFEKSTVGSHIVRCHVSSKTAVDLLGSLTSHIQTGRSHRGLNEYEKTTVLQVMPIGDGELLVEYIRHGKGAA